MAIVASNLTSGADTDGGSSSTTASVSPTSNALILATVDTRTNITADPNEPTLSGNGLTWVFVNSVVYDSTSASRKKISLFRALGASPSSGVITIDYASQAQTDTQWSIDQFTGTDITGTNGSGAIVQSATAKDESLSANSLTVTLAAFSSANNATFGGIACDGVARTPSAGTGFTALGSVIGGNVNTISEYNLSNDTSVDASFSGAANGMLGGVAVEIKEAVANNIVTFITYRPAWRS